MLKLIGWTILGAVVLLGWTAYEQITEAHQPPVNQDQPRERPIGLLEMLQQEVGDAIYR
ncbi:hypothetical protein HY375_03975 [Candidatus Berkelbacteria bacterium]|nr:hypothetical protein [Candidatus Berkelbacteria bacterium]